MTVRIQISIDAELLERIDELRGNLRYKPSRSQIVATALENELKVQNEKFNNKAD